MKKIILLPIMFLLSISLVFAVCQQYTGQFLTDNEITVQILSAEEPGLLSPNFEGEQGSDVEIVVRLRNVGIASTPTRVEAGIFLKQQVRDWFGGQLPGGLLAISGSSFTNIQNCEVSETNADSVLLNLDPGSSRDITFLVKAPVDTVAAEYVVYSGAYLNCYNECGSTTGTGQFNADAKDFNLVSAGIVPVQTCSDGLKNQDETDTDCGGVCGSTCGIAESCSINSDCQSAKCQSGICWDSVTCVESWSCTFYGECVNNQQIRTCNENNKCGTQNNKPQTTQTCDVPPPPGLNGRWIGLPQPSKVVVPVGEPVIITQTFEADIEGDYWLEGSIQFTRPLAIGISGNTCNPEDVFFANKQVHLTEGRHEIEFTVTPVEKGVHVVSTAWVEGCGGRVIDQTTGLKEVRVGSDREIIFPIIPVALGALLFGILFAVLPIPLPMSVKIVVGTLLGGAIGFGLTVIL